MFNANVVQSLNTIAIIIAVIGGVIIIWGLNTSYFFLKAELKIFASRQDILFEARIRFSLVSYLLLGFDFMLAADILHIIHNPILNELYSLAIIVAIRSVISYFLHKEIYPAIMNNKTTDNVCAGLS